MMGKTNSVTRRALTFDATATENSLLYGHTAYGADGTKLTGTGAYWQYVRYLKEAFYGKTGLPENLVLYLPSCTNMGTAFRNCDAKTIEVTTAKLDTTALSNAFYNSAVTRITLNADTSMVINWANAFAASPFLANIDGNPLDMTSLSSSYSFIFTNLPNLVTVAFVASTIKVSLSFVSSPALSTASLLSIANGLDAAAVGNTLTMHATSTTNMDNITVDNVDGVAVLGSAMTLTQFINNIKGWTIA